MREMMRDIEERRQRGDWIEYDVHETGDEKLEPLRVRWWQTDKGVTSTISIGLPNISKSAPPKPRRKWIPVTPVKCLTVTKLQFCEIPIALEWESKRSRQMARTENLMHQLEEAGEEEEWCEEQSNRCEIKQREEKNNEIKLGGPAQKAFEFGTCIDDIYGHSWSDKAGHVVVGAKESAASPRSRVSGGDEGREAIRVPSKKSGENKTERGRFKVVCGSGSRRSDG